MEEIYVEVEALDSGVIQCGLPTAVTTFVVHYLKCAELHLNYVKSKSTSVKCVMSLKPSNLSVQSDIIKFTDLPDLISCCHFPAAASDGDYMARAGLGSVLRHLVKVADKQDSTKKHIALLGYKGVCLKTCAEVSAWTKFCEVDLPESIPKTLESTYMDKSKELVLPLELCKLEAHLAEPAIISNIGKKRREAIKNLQKSVLTKDFQNLKICDTKQKDRDLPGMQHIYAEGTDFTLTDLILFIPVTLFLHKYVDAFEEIQKHLPLVLKWYHHILDNKEVVNAAKQLGIPLIEPSTLSSQTTWRGVVVHPNKDLGIRDSSTKKLKANISGVAELIEKLRPVTDELIGQHPCGEKVTLCWDSFPSALHPSEGELPKKRVERKCQQLENLATAVCHVARPGQVIVDFCSGGGHLGLVLAYLLPECKVILVENKEESITRARRRIQKLHLQNVSLYQCNLDYFCGRFDVGVCLHACGVATDLVLQSCLDNQASFVICPCCYGSIHNTHTISYPRSEHFRRLGITGQECIMLGHAADQTQFDIPQAQTGKKCMFLVDSDRASLAREHGYKVTLCSLSPLSCSPKNNLIVGEKNKL